MRKIKKFLFFVLAVIMAFPMSACKAEKTNKVDASVDYAEGVTVSENGKEISMGEIDDSKKRIKISYTDAGFGSDWLRVMATHFVKENPEYWIFMEGDPGLTANVSVHLGSHQNISDIYMPLAHDWQTYALNGWLEDLSDVYSAIADPDKEVPEGEEAKTVFDKMLPMWQDYCYAFDGTDDKMYAYPWSLGITGIAYNGTMFEQNGWKVPETVPELLELCEKIKTDTKNGVAPFVYPGNTGGYFGFMGQAMWMQYSGIDGYKTFMSFPSAEVYNPEREPGKGKLRMLETFDSIFDESTGNSLAGSMSKGAREAQMSFLRGEAAMIINGSWLETEMIEDIPEGFVMRYMPFPYVEGAKTDESGNVIKVNAASQPDIMLVPKEAAEIEGAKKFLVFISRDDMLCYFTKYTSSMRPFDYSTDAVEENLSQFGKDVINIFETTESYFPMRTGPYRSKFKLETWAGVGYPYLRLIANTDGLTPERCCLGQYVIAQQEWSNWIK